MAAAVERRTVTLNGKGDSLTSATVFNDRIVIDSSVFSRRSSSTSSSVAEFTFSIPENFKPEVARASVILMLNSFLRSSASSSSYDCALQLVGILEQDHLRSEYKLTGVASDDLHALDYSAAATTAFYVLFDHRSSALVYIANAAAALSCEALGANVSFCGDGLSRDINFVAADLKVLLNDSKLVNSGEVNSSLTSVAEIASANGSFREFSRSIRSKTRGVLDSGLRDGSVKDMTITAKALVLSLSSLGLESLDRTELLISRSVSDVGLRCRLSEMSFLRSELVSRKAEILEDADDYLLFLHKIYDFLDLVRNIVSWEAIAAFVSLQETDEAEKSEKKKKKKVVLGKGTAALMQFFINDKLLSIFDLEKLAQDFQSLLDPKGLEFDSVIKKVKEIVESNGKQLKLPKGTRDFAGKQKAIRDKDIATILKVFKRHGGTSLDTPVFELRETLMEKYGEDSKKLVYDLDDQIRQTVPFARYIAMNGLSKFRGCQIGTVYRRDNPSKGRYREFIQCDFDIAGNYPKMEADYEIIYMLTELLDELGIGDYEVKINHKMLLDGMLAICGVPEAKKRDICSIIDKLDKMDFEQAKSEMVNGKGLDEETAQKIRIFVEQRGQPMEMLSRLKQEGGELLSSSEAVVGLNELEILFGFLLKNNPNCMNKIVLDMSLARGLDYYTGLIFEVVDKGMTQVGSIGGGGRYDNMLREFGTKQVPSVGLGLGYERIFDILEQQQERYQDVRATETQVLVSILGNNSTLGMEMVSELWDTKLINAESMTNKSITKLIDYASKSQIPYMAIVGDDELSRGVVKLKNMKDKTSEDVPRSQLVPELLKKLGVDLS